MANNPNDAPTNEDDSRRLREDENGPDLERDIARPGDPSSNVTTSPRIKNN
ncbi:hypothetical protein KPL74_03395 [Bacillus sp. NP157]|nr:hypothetical protein KPL74_03395 [Bacillus sp. NP157]